MSIMGTATATYFTNEPTHWLRLPNTALRFNEKLTVAETTLAKTVDKTTEFAPKKTNFDSKKNNTKSVSEPIHELKQNAIINRYILNESLIGLK